MSFIYRLRLLPVASLLLTAVVAQTCYFPDGITVSSDIPCNSNAAASSCCPSDSFCMDNGLCFGGGVISRASCTDQSWESQECAQYCTTTSKSTTVSLTACGAETQTFSCGLNNTRCQTDKDTFTMSGGKSLVLRPSQIEAITVGASQASHDNHLYSAGTVAGVSMGIGLPLLFALILTLLVLRKEKQRNALEESIRQQTTLVLENRPRSSFSTVSRTGTMTTVDSVYKPQQPKAFMEKYGYNKGFYAQGGDLGVSSSEVFELPDNNPNRKSRRFEAP